MSQEFYQEPPPPPPPQKKSGAQMVFIIVGICALGMVIVCGCMAAIAVPGFLRARETSRMNACLQNLVKIDYAKQQWAVDEEIELDEGASPSLEELGSAGYLSYRPLCPSGGTYTMGLLSEETTCSTHGSASAPILPLR